MGEGGGDEWRQEAAMRVRDRMTPDPITVDADDSLRKVWNLVEEKRLRRFPVMREGRLAGIVTDRDLRNATASSVVMTEKKYHDYLLDTVRIESVMTENPRAVAPDTELKEAARLILDMKVGGLPVMESDRLVGIITETDLIATLVDML